MLIPVKLLKKNEDNYALSSAQITDIKSQISTKSPLELNSHSHILARREMLDNVAPESLDIAFERYIGSNDLLPINYLETGYQKSKSVGRIRFFDLDINQNVLATGFLISSDLVITNHHVFQRRDSFRDAFIEFDYAFDMYGKEKTKIVFALDAQKFFYASEDLDFAVIGIKDTDETQSHKVQERGYLVLNPGIGKVGLGESATIIQYPDGNWEQIALRENQILDVTNPNAITYESDTSVGSSGSSVFNDQWQVIALHSAGVAKKDGNENYIDSEGNPVPVINDRVDSSKIVWISNTGIRISAIVNYLFTNLQTSNNQYIQFLKNPNYTDAKSKAYLSQPSKPAATASLCVNEIIASPKDVSLLPPITITITIGNQTHTIGTKESIPSSPVLVTEAFEAKIEDDMDYSNCPGFDEYFMGIHTPLPLLNPQLKRKIASYKDNPNNYILKYYHYSTIHHSLRKMPVVSAINVDGNPVERQDKAARVDKWLRDNRIDYDIQLSEDYYKKSGFDKGHMSRREDAKWGDTPDEAEKDAQLTCMYTNAVPQVPAINRDMYQYHGLWGHLEKIILESGVKKENGKTTKICVYNGPVFVDIDPIYKSVQVPMRFFKIVVWINSAGTPKTTAFILSQEDLVGGIQFEDLHFDQEFIEHQCSVNFIEGLTSLSFEGIKQYDTYKKDGSSNEVKVIRDGDLERHIIENIN